MPWLGRRWLWAILSLAWLSSSASAHLEFPKLKGERQLAVSVQPERITVRYRIGFGPALADELRKAADKSGDSEVSALEGNRALDARTERLLASLRVCIGSSLDDLSCRQVSPQEVERVEAEGWVPGPERHLHFTWTLRLNNPSAAAALKLFDSYDVPGLEISEVTLGAAQDLPLLQAGPPGRSTAVEKRFTWVEVERRPGPRTIEMVWRRPSRSPWIWLALSAGAVALAVGLWWLGRGRRRV